MNDPLATSGRAVAAGTGTGTGAMREASDDRQDGRLTTTKWIGWRLRALVAAALLGCVGVFALSTWLAMLPQPAGRWAVSDDGRDLVLLPERLASTSPAPRTLVEITDGTEQVAVDGGLMIGSTRWQPDEALARDRSDRRARLAQILAHPGATLVFADGSTEPVDRHDAGAGSLPTMYWILSAAALGLYLVAVVVLTSRPSLRNALYALMAWLQVGQLLLMAISFLPGLAPAPGLASWEREARLVADLLSVGVVVHVASLHPTRVPQAGAIAAGAWLLVLTLSVLVMGNHLPEAWAWVQTTMLSLGVIAMGVLTWSHRLAPHPYAVLLRRFVMMCTGVLSLLTLGVAVTRDQPTLQATVVTIGPVLFHGLQAGLLLLLPFLSRSQQVVREFALLASVSTLATILDLLFVVVFSLGQVASLTLTLFLALGAYAGARQWLMNRMLGSSVVTTERMFEHLYRVAREVEARPQAAVKQVTRLLRDLYEPLEVLVAEQPLVRARVSGQGSTLTVPVPDLDFDNRNATHATPQRAIVIRYAGRGRRLFTVDDARLGDRIVEQLRRAVAFDKAVERGRSEERTRIAHDLHDDIGARLLTLMYKAQSSEMEEYVRHTLQDLKTLTRGLAASSHGLADAAAEWKADLAQRLSLAHIDLSWTMQAERDLALSVVQWSGLTRVLRELASNVISHAQATHVAIELNYQADRLELSVSDDGIGRNPQAWSHGLGLGGVRKRVKQLGGEVEWVELRPAGIACKVVIQDFSQRP